MLGDGAIVEERREFRDVRKMLKNGIVLVVINKISSDKPIGSY